MKLVEPRMSTANVSSIVRDSKPISNDFKRKRERWTRLSGALASRRKQGENHGEIRVSKVSERKFRPTPMPILARIWVRGAGYTTVYKCQEHMSGARGAPVLERYFKDVTASKLVEIHASYNPECPIINSPIVAFAKKQDNFTKRNYIWLGP